MNTNRHVDYIIVGQGLAGSLLAFFLHKRGKTLLLVDPPPEDTASRVAAGIINPVTGRHYVKSWRIDEFLPFARQTYRELESLLSDSFYSDRNVLRALFSTVEENNWNAKLGDPAYAAYVLPKPEPAGWPSLLQPVQAFGELAGGAQVNLARFLDSFRAWIAQNHRLVSDHFEYEDLDRTGELLRYKEWSARAIVFCEGYSAKNNPYFTNLPYEGAKGEVLLISLPGLKPEKLLRHHLFLVPLEDGTYWAGSNYIWKYKDQLPTPEGLQWLTSQLGKVLKVPYEILNHKAAIRPTVKDRRPLLGVHPAFSNIFIFNGLGTKGASQGPFFARQMADFLTQNEALDPEVDIRRFDAKTR